MGKANKPNRRSSQVTDWIFGHKPRKKSKPIPVEDEHGKDADSHFVRGMLLPIRFTEPTGGSHEDRTQGRFG